MEKRFFAVREISPRVSGLASLSVATNALLRVAAEDFFSLLGSSTIVFHSPQAGQRPIHLGLSLPQEVQNQTVFAVAITHQIILMQDTKKSAEKRIISSRR
jgi:hypothetical protein